VSKNIIELNGKRYDAITGAYLGESEASGVVKVAAHRAAKAHTHKGRAIDGIVSPSHTPALAPKQQAHHAEPKNKAAPAHQHVAKKPAARQAYTVAAHQPEKPKTLMRHVVKKPQIDMKPAIKPQAPAEIAAKPVSTLVPKLSISQVSPARLARAKRTPQSRFVKRFDVSNAAVIARQPAPQQRSATMQRPTPVAARAAAAPPAVVAPAPKQPPQDMFEAALANATSHQEPAPRIKMKRRHSKLLNATAGVAAFLIIGGFIAYLNMPNIEMRVASVHAGFSAQLPGYKPTGYAMSGVKNEGSAIRVSFHSGDQSYTITQQASDWDSQTLLDNSVALGGGPRQTIQSKGRTIYLFNDHSSWVSSGVRYDITGNAQLNPSDVASIAASM
jgi:hypothetical protein